MLCKNRIVLLLFMLIGVIHASILHGALRQPAQRVQRFFKQVVETPYGSSASNAGKESLEAKLAYGYARQRAERLKSLKMEKELKLKREKETVTRREYLKKIELELKMMKEKRAELNKKVEVSSNKSEQTFADRLAKLLDKWQKVPISESLKKGWESTKAVCLEATDCGFRFLSGLLSDPFTAYTFFWTVGGVSSAYKFRKEGKKSSKEYCNEQEKKYRDLADSGNIDAIQAEIDASSNMRQVDKLREEVRAMKLRVKNYSGSEIFSELQSSTVNAVDAYLKNVEGYMCKSKSQIREDLEKIVSQDPSINNFGKNLLINDISNKVDSCLNKYYIQFSSLKNKDLFVIQFDALNKAKKIAYEKNSKTAAKMTEKSSPA